PAIVTVRADAKLVGKAFVGRVSEVLLGGIETLGLAGVAAGADVIRLVAAAVGVAAVVLLVEHVAVEKAAGIDDIQCLQATVERPGGEAELILVSGGVE